MQKRALIFFLIIVAMSAVFGFIYYKYGPTSATGSVSKGNWDKENGLPRVSSKKN